MTVHLLGLWRLWKSNRTGTEASQGIGERLVSFHNICATLGAVAVWNRESRYYSRVV